MSRENHEVGKRLQRGTLPQLLYHISFRIYFGAWPTTRQKVERAHRLQTEGEIGPS